VLVDSERLAVEIDVRAIGELGWPITREEVIERHLGLSEADALADIESVIGRPVPAEWLCHGVRRRTRSRAGRRPGLGLAWSPRGGGCA
jgi:hypothetical protein